MNELCMFKIEIQQAKLCTRSPDETAKNASRINAYPVLTKVQAIIGQLQYHIQMIKFGQLPYYFDLLPVIACGDVEFITSRAFAKHRHVGCLYLITALTTQILCCKNRHLLLDYLDEFPFHYRLVKRMLAYGTWPDRVANCTGIQKQIDIFT